MTRNARPKYGANGANGRRANVNIGGMGGLSGLMSASPAIDATIPEGPVTEMQAKAGMQTLPTELNVQQPGWFKNFVSGGKAQNEANALQNQLLMARQAQQQALAQAAAVQAMQQSGALEMANLQQGFTERNNLSRAGFQEDEQLRQARLANEAIANERGYKESQKLKSESEGGQAALDAGYVNNRVAPVMPGVVMAPEQLARVARARMADLGSNSDVVGIPTAASNQAAAIAGNDARMPYFPSLARSEATSQFNVAQAGGLDNQIKAATVPFAGADAASRSGILQNNMNTGRFLTAPGIDPMTGMTVAPPSSYPTKVMGTAQIQGPDGKMMTIPHEQVQQVNSPGGFGQANAVGKIDPEGDHRPKNQSSTSLTTSKMSNSAAAQPDVLPAATQQMPAPTLMSMQGLVPLVTQALQAYQQQQQGQNVMAPAATLTKKKNQLGPWMGY